MRIIPWLHLSVPFSYTLPPLCLSLPLDLVVTRTLIFTFFQSCVCALVCLFFLSFFFPVLPYHTSLMWHAYSFMASPLRTILLYPPCVCPYSWLWSWRGHYCSRARWPKAHCSKGLPLPIISSRDPLRPSSLIGRWWEVLARRVRKRWVGRWIQKVFSEKII